MRRNFQGSDRGKRVVTTDGSAVGTLVRVEGERAYVLPDAEQTRSRRGQSGGEERSTITIDRRAVEESTNEVVRLVEETNPAQESPNA